MEQQVETLEELLSKFIVNIRTLVIVQKRKNVYN